MRNYIDNLFNAYFNTSDISNIDNEIDLYNINEGDLLVHQDGTEFYVIEIEEGDYPNTMIVTALSNNKIFKVSDEYLKKCIKL